MRISYSNKSYRFFRFRYCRLLEFILSKNYTKTEIARALDLDVSTLTQQLKRYKKYKEQDTLVAQELSQKRSKAGVISKQNHKTKTINNY